MMMTIQMLLNKIKRNLRFYQDVKDMLFFPSALHFLVLSVRLLESMEIHNIQCLGIFDLNLMLLLLFMLFDTNTIIN